MLAMRVEPSHLIDCDLGRGFRARRLEHRGELGFRVEGLEFRV